MAHRLTNGAVFSHESAALIHGLWLLRTPTTVHVTQRHRDNREAAIEATGAIRMRLLEKLQESARHGRRQARAVIEHAEAFSESPYESVIRWIALSRGLPSPVLQQRFDIRGNTYYTDIYWEFELVVDGEVFRLCLIAEYDGQGKYLGDLDDGSAWDPEAAARAVIREKQREDDLRSLPNTVVQRFDRRDTRALEATFRRLCTELPASYRTSVRVVPELVGLLQPQGRRRTV